MAYFEPCFRGDFRSRIQGRGYDSGQCGSDPGAYEALVGGGAGPALSASAPETLSGLQTVSVPLATALSLYNWKWLSNPDQAAEADVLVRIWWMTDGPQYITERADPFYRPGLSFGTGIGFGSSPWHRGPFGYARQAFYVPEPSIQAIYSRVLVVEALRADALPKATLEALLPAAKPSGIASKPAPAAKPDGDPSKGPYAPPIALEGEALSKPPMPPR